MLLLPTTNRYYWHCSLRELLRVKTATSNHYHRISYSPPAPQVFRGLQVVTVAGEISTSKILLRRWQSSQATLVGEKVKEYTIRWPKLQKSVLSTSSSGNNVLPAHSPLQFLFSSIHPNLHRNPISANRFRHSRYSNTHSSGRVKWFWRGVHTSARNNASRQNVAYTSKSIRSGFSRHSLMRTRNCTASRPSSSRWS